LIRKVVTMTRAVACWLPAILLAVQAGPALASDEGAIQVATRFCEARLAYDEEATRALLTPILLQAIAVAEARNKVIADANPDEKPPLGDGVPYQSYLDLPSTCVPGAAESEDGLVTIEVAYGFDDDPDAGWTDLLVLVQTEGGDPAVDDVLYFRRSEDDEQYGLRRSLIEMFSYWDEPARE
jgi:hypothetical protein